MPIQQKKPWSAGYVERMHVYPPRSFRKVWWSAIRNRDSWTIPPTAAETEPPL